MSFVEAVGIALSSLRANRLRSLLTLLGIVIGVMAVIAVVSIISGLNDYVAGKIFNLGPDVVTVTRMSPVITSLDEFIEGQKRGIKYGRFLFFNGQIKRGQTFFIIRHQGN